MAGIYIHIPYCRQKCHYCNFYSLATTKFRNEIIDALVKEAELKKKYLGGEIVDTIYLGGGTPSLLDGAELDRIFAAISGNFALSSDPEITLEANPDDLRPGKIKELKSSMVNRLSIGIQSFREEDLVYLNRVHTAEEALNAVKRSQDAGIGGLSIDLIYGIPTLSSEGWQENIEQFLELNIEHLSAYALTVEEGTALARFIRKGRLKAPDEEAVVEQFHLLMKTMRHHRFIHYEVSNFCRNNRFARHNTSYWKGVRYLGLGPSAHSYNGDARHWNVSNLKDYIDGIRNGKPVLELESLSPIHRYNEYVLLTLRTMWGTDIRFIQQEFGEDFGDFLVRAAIPHLENGRMTRENDTFYLSDLGKLFADGITADLFMDRNPG